MKAAKGGGGWKECVSTDAEGSCHRSITCSPLQSSLHHRAREEERTAVSKANRAEERAAEGRKKGKRNHWRWRWGGGGGGGASPGVLVRSTGALSLWFSSIALPLFSIPVTLLHGLLVPPPGCVLPFLSPPPSLCPRPPAEGARVASAELELHTVVVRACRNCDGLNGTVELLTSRSRGGSHMGSSSSQQGITLPQAASAWT